MLTRAEPQSPDVLMLYDCCYPVHGSGSIKPGRAVVELLAAVRIRKDRAGSQPRVLYQQSNRGAGSRLHPWLSAILS